MALEIDLFDCGRLLIGGRFFDDVNLALVAGLLASCTPALRALDNNKTVRHQRKHVLKCTT